ncbi:transcriptional regulator, LysR family [Thalassovita litoralis]|jgi:DNA-binding transcriptional LysR family regulator|uniref:Transcriptional regulator, LysR family n=1 Tax=Thalassovita litoralis TaxID=1010611 RepID=A0A521FHD7_9RHOB|nr:LysR family transcriptional regulator [Thalassovita litoralis]SMO95622.1 transcriptional regulator, LysR family [Thalassovita litoralis]
MSVSSSHFDHLRLRQLRLLDLIARHGSLRAVAGEMNLTQPAISQMLKDLEFAFGTKLVDRSVRGVSLSPAGQIAVQRARAGLAIFEHLAADLASDRPTVVRIGTNPAVLFHLLPIALGHLGLEQSQMQFRIHSGTVSDMMQRLWSGELDCYVGRVDWGAMAPGMSDLLRYEPLTQTDLVLACSTDHPLAKQSSVSAADLAKCAWAMQSDRTNNRAAIETAFRHCGVVAPAPTVEVDADPTALSRLALLCGLVICVPRAAVNASFTDGRLHILTPTDMKMPSISLSFVTLKENDSVEALNCLHQALLQAVASAPDLREGDM